MWLLVWLCRRRWNFGAASAAPIAQPWVQMGGEQSACPWLPRWMGSGDGGASSRTLATQRVLAGRSAWELGTDRAGLLLKATLKGLRSSPLEAWLCHATAQAAAQLNARCTAQRVRPPAQSFQLPPSTRASLLATSKGGP